MSNRFDRSKQCLGGGYKRAFSSLDLWFSFQTHTTTPYEHWDHDSIPYHSNHLLLPYLLNFDASFNCKLPIIANSNCSHSSTDLTMSSVGGSGDGNGDKNKKGKQGIGDKSLGSGSTEKLPLKSTSKTASPAPACEQRSTSDTQPRKKMSGSAGDSQRSGPGSYLPPPAPPPVQHNQRLVPGQGYLPSGLQPVYATSPPVNMQMMPPGQSAGHGRGQSTHPPPPMLQQGQLPAQQPVWMSQSAVPQPVYATKAQMLQLGQRAGGQSGASAPMPTNPQTLLPHIGDNPHVEHGFQVRVELESRASSRDPPKVRLPNQPELSPTKTTQAVQRTPA